MGERVPTLDLGKSVVYNSEGLECRVFKKRTILFLHLFVKKTIMSFKSLFCK